MTQFACLHFRRLFCIVGFCRFQGVNKDWQVTSTLNFGDRKHTSVDLMQIRALVLKMPPQFSIGVRPIGVCLVIHQIVRAT